MKASRRYACALGALTFVLSSAYADDLDRDRDRERSRGPNVLVDCGAGESVAKALARGDERKTLVVRIQGTCSESILVNRNDVTLLAAAPGATIRGPDPATDTIRVTGSRVTIDGLTVTGGRNGITGDGAPGLVVRNAAVQSTGRTGVVFAQGTSGIVDSSVVASNARDGVAIDAATGSVVNSQIAQNARHGVGVFNGGAGRIGLDPTSNPGGNVITGNGFAGIHIVFGSTALIALNQVTGNGASADPTAIRIGVNLASASADLIGGNTISGNAGSGINLSRSSAVLGDATFGFGTVNTISGNGSATSQGGIVGFLSSSITVRDAVVTGNAGSGLILSLNSSAQVVSTTIQNNTSVGPGTGDGVRLQLGSTLLASPPAGNVSGNAGFGLACSDPESSAVGSLGIGANGLGAVSCTGF